MNALPVQFLMMLFAGWVNRQQREVIEYLEEENRVLRELLGRKRLLLSDRQRRRLAAKAKTVGRNGEFQPRKTVDRFGFDFQFDHVPNG